MGNAREHAMEFNEDGTGSMFEDSSPAAAGASLGGGGGGGGGGGASAGVSTAHSYLRLDTTFVLFPLCSSYPGGWIYGGDDCGTRAGRTIPPREFPFLTSISFLYCLKGMYYGKRVQREVMQV